MTPFTLRTIVLVLGFSLFAGLSACGDTAALVRKVTYPPDFKYVSTAELRSSMDQLAFQLQLLDQMMADSAAGQAVQQQQVVDTLRNIEHIGTDLQAGEAGANHPFLQDHMSDFVLNVGQARIAASLEPPRYYLAGRVAGGCINCHKVNR